MDVETRVVAGCEALIARGTGPIDVVLLHGAFSHGRHFRAWLDVLAERGLRAAAPTLRPEGSAVEGRRVRDYVATARDVVKALATPGIRPALVGHSMGGLVAQKLAEEGECSALAVVASAPAGMLTAQPGAVPYLAPLVPRILAGKPLAPREATIRALVLHDMDAAHQEALVPTFVPESGAAYRDMIFGLVRVDARAVRVPVLCLGGRADRIVSRGLVRATARHLGGERREYDGRGHWLVGGPGASQVADDVAAWLLAQRRRAALAPAS